LALIQLIYRSRSLIDPRHGASMLDAILNQAERQNRVGGVTGCLAHTDDHFVQLLEGAPASVDATFMRLRRDPRHTDVEILLTRPVRGRAFPSWCMARFDLAGGEAPDAFSAIGLTSAFSIDSTPPAQMLLLLMAIADHKRLAA
jgi:hypothetical protein